MCPIDPRGRVLTVVVYKQKEASDAVARMEKMYLDLQQEHQRLQMQGQPNLELQNQLRVSLWCFCSRFHASFLSFVIIFEDCNMAMVVGREVLQFCSSLILIYWFIPGKYLFYLFVDIIIVTIIIEWWWDVPLKNNVVFIVQ